MDLYNLGWIVSMERDMLMRMFSEIIQLPFWNQSLYDGKYLVCQVDLLVTEEVPWADRTLSVEGQGKLILQICGLPMGLTSVWWVWMDLLGFDRLRVTW